MVALLQLHGAVPGHCRYVQTAAAVLAWAGIVVLALQVRRSG